MTYGARILIGIFVVITIVSVVIGNSNDKVENNVVNNNQIKKDGLKNPSFLLLNSSATATA